jgi:hypothetical protein
LQCFETAHGNNVHFSSGIFSDYRIKCSCCQEVGQCASYVWQEKIMQFRPDAARIWFSKNELRQMLLASWPDSGNYVRIWIYLVKFVSFVIIVTSVGQHGYFGGEGIIFGIFSFLVFWLRNLPAERSIFNHAKKAMFSSFLSQTVH